MRDLRERLLGLVLAVGTVGMVMGVTLTGSKWHPSFMTASEILSGVHITVQFGPHGRVTGYGGCNRFSGASPVNQDRPTGLDAGRAAQG